MSCIVHSEGSLPYSPTEPFSSLKKTEESTKRKLSAAMDWKKKRKEGDGDERGMGQGGTHIGHPQEMGAVGIPRRHSIYNRSQE